MKPGDEPAVPARARGGLAAAAGQDFSLATAVGGPRGAVEAVLPTLVFVVWFSVTHELKASVWAALTTAGVALIARVVSRSAPTQAIGGVLGVVVCALLAARTGEARNFYLPGLLINVGYALVLGVSTLRTPAFRIFSWRVPRGPFPVLGLLIGPLVGEGLAWRSDPPRLRAYRQATLLFAGLFLLRLVVQLPLFLADAVDALGVARLAMGLPAFALTIWLVWRLLRAVPPATPHARP